MTEPSRYLFVTWEGGGNVPAVLGAARQLVERGHDVRVLTEPCLRPAVEGIGARFVAFNGHFSRSDRQQHLLVDWKALTPAGGLDGALRDVLFGPADDTAAAVEAALDAEPADAVVADWMMPAALAVAEARNLPTAALVHCINMIPGPGRPSGPFAPARGWLGRLRDLVVEFLIYRVLVGRYATPYNGLRRRLGLAPLPALFDQYQRTDRVLVQTCAEFDFLASPEPDHVVYVGPILDEPDWMGGERWESPWREDDPRPLVVVSLSTTFQDQRSVLQAVVTALGRLDVRGLVTLGPAMAGAELEVPENVVVVPAAPHGQVFELADAFVTHCGHGSTMRALARGLPLVALPMGRDQDGTATRIVHRGLGLQPQRSPEAIAGAIRRVLDEPHFREAARRMAEHISADVRSGRLLAELEALPSRRRPGAGSGPEEPPRPSALTGSP